MLLLGLVAIVLFVADRVMKYWVLESFALGEARAFIPGVLQFRYVQNTGIAFSFFAESQWVPMVLTPILLIVLGFILVKGMFPCRVQQLCIVAVMVGGISNWLDRILFGFVVDMLDPVFVRFAVFNLADCYIVVGAAVFFVAYVLAERRRVREQTLVSTEAEGE